MRHARVMRDFPSRKSGNPLPSIKKIKKFSIYYIRYDSNLIVTENDFSPHKRTFRGYLISWKTIYPLRKCSCLHHRKVITLLSCRRHRRLGSTQFHPLGIQVPAKRVEPRKNFKDFSRDLRSAMIRKNGLK